MSNWNLNFLEDENFPNFEPATIWINFYGKTKLFKEDFERILHLFGSYPKSELVMINLKKEDRKILKELFQDFRRVKVLVK